ncbi:MAG: acetylornithine deacetylase [Burkholderiales bacterium]|nr:acetylornithine deacetylase [Burkholderiales bacterium]
MSSDAALPVRPASLEMIERLIGFNTVSRESNLGLIEWVRDWLKSHGIESVLVHDAEGRKANLFATIHGAGAPRGGAAAPGIVLSGHTDVVPVDGQDWDTDPFRATVRDGRLYGRGACDMKGFLGVALAMAPRFAAADLRMPLHYALSYDEEVGCVGVRGLIDALGRQGFRASGVIVGEPTSMQVIVAHKGKRSYRCTVHGREAHSALAPQGVNAIEYAARVITYIRHLADRMRQLEPRDNGFDVPFTTLQTGTIRGGTALNIVPRECVFDWEFRYLPGADPEAIEAEVRNYALTLVPEMRQVAAEAGIDIRLTSEAPGSNAADTDAVTRLAIALARNPTTAKVAYATEAGLFERAGLPSIICGPGSIEQAHKPNEYCALEQLGQCEAFMERLLAQASA